MQGTIKKIVEDKGFGFIAVEGEEKDLFFHATRVVDVQFADLREGDAVSFDREDSDRGPMAVNVTRV